MRSPGVRAATNFVSSQERGPNLVRRGEYTMSGIDKPPFNLNELDEIEKANRAPMSVFMVVAGVIALVVILALLIWSLAS